LLGAAVIFLLLLVLRKVDTTAAVLAAPTHCLPWA
jgi:hypothetical protein